MFVGGPSRATVNLSQLRLAFCESPSTSAGNWLNLGRFLNSLVAPDDVVSGKFVSSRVSCCFGGNELAGRQGFEPRYRGPEPRVLPLDDLPVPVAAVADARTTHSSQSKSGPASRGWCRDVAMRCPPGGRQCVRSLSSPITSSSPDAVGSWFVGSPPIVD